MLIASLYQQRGETIKSIQYALKAENLVNNIDNDGWKVRVCGFLATQYRIAGLFAPAKDYLEKASNITQKIKDPQVINSTMGLIKQEMAYNAMAHKRYGQALIYIQQSQHYFGFIKENFDFFSFENEQLLGLNYYCLKDDVTALKHYNRAHTLGKSMPKNHITALVYNGLANIYLNRNDLLEAKKCLDSAGQIANTSHYLQLKKEVNETAYRYYVVTNKINKILEIKKTQDSIATEIYKKSADFVNNSYVNLHLEKKEEERTKKNKITFLTIGILLILPIMLYFVLPSLKQKKKEQLIIDNTTEETESPTLPSTYLNPVKEEDSQPEMQDEQPIIIVKVPDQVVDKIMIRLKEFEKKQYFINRDISLSYLAHFCETNGKYLSIIINSQKKKDFYNYINDLRINYIADKLRGDPYYRRLKISALAEEAGFSSQGKFTLNFKKIIGVTPSEFIKTLKDLE
jgi:AraC-type DNA-binding domain-containing proteins